MAEQIQVRFKLGDYFRPKSHKVALALPELVSQTNSFSVKNRPGCAPTLEGSKPKELYLAYNVKCNLKNSDPNGHDVNIRFDVSQVYDATTAKNLDVAVNCSCPAFLYWGGQWNAHQRDALEGEPRPLLTAPTERLDLRENFVICKHIKAVSERILPSVQHNIVKILRQREVELNKGEGKKPAKPSLTQRQEEMRKRQEKKKKAPTKRDNKKVREQLEKGLAERENDVVKRDTPATPEEQERIPSIPPQDIDAPDAHGQHLMQDIPEIEGLEEAEEPTPEPPPPSAAPPAARKPQKMPMMTQMDREEMKRMQREEQRRQQRQQEQRLRNMQRR